MDHSTLLNAIAASVDLTEAQHQAIEDRYSAIANHLASDTSILKPYSPDILPQGSFMLGTMIKPIAEDDEIDVDLVCRLRDKDKAWTQFDLKKKVGDQISSSATYDKMLVRPDRRRCWRIDYEEKTRFHLDILPAVIGARHFDLLQKRFNDLSSNEINLLSVSITDNQLPNYRSETNMMSWLKSNPFGYGAWFASRKQLSQPGQVRMLNEAVEPLPRYDPVKTPLQRIVQILKRHRDVMFGPDEDRPISIIITTLAAKAYQGESNVLDGIRNVLNNMESYVEEVFDVSIGKQVKKVSNPVNAVENFADKWNSSNQKEENFYGWLDKAKTDFANIQQGTAESIYGQLKLILGTRAVNEGYRNSGNSRLITEGVVTPESASAALRVSHRQLPGWPITLDPNCYVEIFGNFKQGKKRFSISTRARLPKGSDIYFNASTNVKKPFDVYWQVVNTGAEASRIAGGLRGQIFPAKTRGAGGLSHTEKSEYAGTHWIQCFIVKDGVCIAKSSEFFVIIA